MASVKLVEVSNWNLTEKSQAQLAEAGSIEDVQRVLLDTVNFPSPVLAVGSLHSVNACVTNPGGTFLNVSKMNAVLGLEAHGVRCQAGCKMADIYDWLAQQDLELSFCPEIGDATVGSLAVTTSKDSSIDGPGYLSALVTEVKYVDEDGSLVTLTRTKTPQDLVAFTCSYGMMGVVVEVVLDVRCRIPITSRGFTFLAKAGGVAAAKLQKARSRCDNMFAIMVPDRDYVYVETRKKAKKAAFIARSPVMGFLGTAGENEITKAVMVKLKYKCFLLGQPPGRKTSAILRDNPFPVTHFRNLFTNRYPAVEPGTRRLDFSYFEFDLPSFEAVVEGCWAFHQQYKQQHGFGPRGYAIYFVNRGWQPTSAAAAGKGSQAAADVVGSAVGVQKVPSNSNVSSSDRLPAKPYGNYSWAPGVSFMLDPLTDDADNPQWLAFNEAYTAWAVSMGAIPSLSQTKGLKPGQAALPKHLTRERFLTPYYKAFVV